MAETSSLNLTSAPLSIIGTREFDAPRELAWSVWTDPKHLAKFST